MEVSELRLEQSPPPSPEYKEESFSKGSLRQVAKLPPSQILTELPFHRFTHFDDVAKLGKPPEAVPDPLSSVQR